MSGVHRVVAATAFPRGPALSDTPAWVGQAGRPGKGNTMDTHIAADYRARIGRDLAGRVALVTGSTSGIGLGIARALAGRGAAIMLNGLGVPDATAEIQQNLANETGVQVLYSGADMSDPSAIEGMLDMARDMLGG